MWQLNIITMYKDWGKPATLKSPIKNLYCFCAKNNTLYAEMVKFPKLRKQSSLFVDNEMNIEWNNVIKNETGGKTELNWRIGKCTRISTNIIEWAQDWNYI